MAVQTCMRLPRSKLVVVFFLLAAVVLGMVGILHRMLSWHQPVDAVNHAPYRALAPQPLQSEEHGWEAKAISRYNNVDPPKFESTDAQEEIKAEVSYIVSKTLKLTTPVPHPKTEVDSAVLGKMTNMSTPELQVSHMQSVANETCDQTCRWWREQSNRQRRIQETCSDVLHKRTKPIVHYYLTPRTLRSLSHLLVLDSHKLIYCYVPKVGCTNWKRLFLVAEGVFPSIKQIGQRQAHLATDSHMRTLSSYPIAIANRLLKEYKKFIFVRHPFERILSAYIDKFQLDYPSSKLFREANGLKMARYGDLSKTPRRKDGTLNITFQQFARFVGDPQNQNLEPHWQEMYSQCQPCMINYDYIGKYITLKEDADFIIKATKLNQVFPDSTNPTGSSKRDKLRKYFSQLTPTDVESLYRRYSIDFQLFGYSVPPYISNRTFS